MRIGWLDAYNLSAYAAGFADLEGRHARNGPASVPMEGFGACLRFRWARKNSPARYRRPFWAILPALGEWFGATAIDSRRWANFVTPILLTAPRDETVGTNAETSGRLHETHDAFAR